MSGLDDSLENASIQLVDQSNVECWEFENIPGIHGLIDQTSHNYTRWLARNSNTYSTASRYTFKPDGIYKNTSEPNDARNPRFIWEYYDSTGFLFDSNNMPSGIDTSLYLKKLKVTFMVNVVKKDYVLARIPDQYDCVDGQCQRYFAGNLLIEKTTNGSETQYSAENTLNVLDFNGMPAGILEKVFVDLPINLDTIINKDSKTFKTHEVDGKLVSYTMDDCQYARACITLDQGEVLPTNSEEWENNYNPTFANEKPLHIPFSVQVIAPNATRNLVGDIYDRYYEVQSNINYVNIEMPPLDSSYYDDATFWMDKASTTKSIGVSKTENKWESLINANGVLNTHIPRTIREKIEELVDRQTRLDDGYFGVILSQLNTFFENILRELVHVFNPNEKQAIVDMCKFKYDMREVRFPVFRGYWNQEVRYPLASNITEI